MKKIKDLNIIVDFLSGVNISPNAKFDCLSSLKYFFNTLADNIRQISTEVNTELTKIDAMYERTIVDKLARHHSLWKN